MSISKVTTDSIDIKDYILTNELGKRMYNMVSPIYENSKIALYLYNALGTVMSKDIDFVKGDFIAQIFPQTATWGLRYWEDEYGIITDESKSIQQRRQNLMNVLYSNKPITPYRIKQIVYSITGLDSDVEENTAPNTITISIYGYVPNITELITVFNKKIPAHINYIVEMAEQEFIDVKSYSGIGVHEFETINVEVVQ